MAGAMLVLNAGSSSLKFSVFVDDEPPRPLLRGQLEALSTQPRFVARRGRHREVGGQQWAAGTNLGHGGAIVLPARLVSSRCAQRTSAWWPWGIGWSTAARASRDRFWMDRSWPS